MLQMTRDDKISGALETELTVLIHSLHSLLTLMLQFMINLLPQL